jgi:hypothetical protein
MLPPHPHPHPTRQDIFSLGCVVAELFLDGKATFDLAQLLAYRRKQYDPAPLLAGLAPDIRDMVAHMLQQDPGGWPRGLAALSGCVVRSQPHEKW